MTRDHIVFDIETVPLPAENCQDLLEPFNPDLVKLGNIKDPIKQAEKIEEARVKHEQSKLNRAALSPLTARVAAIGFKWADGEEILIDNEAVLIRTFFDWFETVGELWVGFNIANFDVPMLVRRAWSLGIPLPKVRNLVNPRNRISNWFCDLAEIWRCGTYPAEHISLDRLARFLGVGSKTMSGAGFATLLYDPDQAAGYLKNDLELTWAIAERLGVIQPAEGVAGQPNELKDEIPFF